MKKEFKFRAWDGVDYMSNPFTLSDIQEKKIQFTSDAIIMQFMGLKDINGKDIYEDDVLSDKQDNYRVWIEPGKMLIGGINKDWDEYISVNTEKLSIIGNIHQNPNLLK